MSENARNAHRARAGFVAALKIRGAKDTDYSACEMIFGELVGNVVRHAAGAIEVRLEWFSDEAVLSVRDSGKMFEFDPMLPRDPLQENGRGLYIVCALAEHFDMESAAGGGKTVRVILPVVPRSSL